MKSVAIVDYGMGNLDSVARAVQECGGRPVVTSSPDDIRSSSLLLLPGVGGFRDGINSIRERGLDGVVREQVDCGVPLLGLCLGMQLLADIGTEGGDHVGLGLIPGTIQRIQRDAPTTRIPHVGWNEVLHDGASPLFAEIPSGKDFYFVHSFHFVPAHEEAVLGRTPYAGGFVSAVGRGHVFGLQFHPEKSQGAGFQILRNFIRL
jgi:imidazole glycerol-phosphate synthase subunit HisH